jgi:2-oxoglutarate ferredoxin oxidoreductase subunit beta
LLHAARNNINILHITCDNENYALTTGQASPTTPLNAKTNSTPE